MSEIVGVWQEPGGSWRWAYRSEETFLEGNERHPSREEAVAAARLAYPGVEIRDLPARRPDPGPRDRPGLLTALVAGAATALGTAALLRRLRRRSRG